MKKGVYSGSFDPITKGHIDIIRRASNLCDKLIVAVLENSSKTQMFTLEERVSMVTEDLIEYKNIEVVSFKGLLVEYMKKEGIKHIFRGIRAASDYEYELGIALANSEISKGTIETVFIPSNREFMYLSSTIVREIGINNGPIELYLTDKTTEKMREKLKK